MATTTNFTCNKDARVAVSGGSNMGSGTSDGLPYGTYSGYKYRTLLGFSINMAGWTSITKAELHVKSSNQIHVAFGSDPTFVVQRMTGAWSEGSSSGLSTSNAVVYGGPAVVGTNQIQKDAPTTENTWSIVDITAMMRDVLNGGAFTGLKLIGTDNSSNESGSAANVGEIYSRESGSGTAYIAITYETNRAPDAPTIASPDVANGGLCGSQTPTLNVTMTDPDGNAINNYHWQIDDNADFSSPIQDVTVGSGGANGFTAAVVPAALTRGGTYYFRAQSADVSVWGGWSNTFSFKVASLPTLTVSEPSASGRLARLQFDAGSGWGSPRMLVNWNMSCPDGGSQASWRVEVFNDSGGAVGTSLNDSNTVGDTTSARIVPANLIEGNYYHVRVTATCSHGLTSVVGTTRVRARWGVAVYSGDMGATPIGSLTLTSLDVTDETTGGSGRVVVEYQTVAAPGIPGAWSSSIGGAGLNRYFYYRVWLLTWGASPAVSPTLNQLNITYTTAVIVPDKWQVSDANNVVGDVSSYVYGTKSLRMKGTGNWLTAHQQIPVVPNTNYVISGRIQTSGPVTAAYVGLATNNTGGGDVLQAPLSDYTKAIAFESPVSRVVSGIWNSGNNTSIWVRLSSFAPVGTSVWYDAIKAEASTVITPWSPGYVANAVVLDAGGLQIDASNGGIFRLKGSAGGARDIVEVGANGLNFGGDASAALYSPAGSILRTAGRLDASGGVLAPYVMAGDFNTLRIGGDGASTGKWFKLAHGTITGQYWWQSIKGVLMSRYDIWDVDVQIASDGGANVQPTPIRVNAIGRVVLADHPLVRVVVTGVNPINYEVWAQSANAWTDWTWFPTSFNGAGAYPVLDNPGLVGWYAATPAGTNYDSAPRIDGHMTVGGSLGVNQAPAAGSGNIDATGHIWAAGSMSASGFYNGSTLVIEPQGLFIQRGQWSIPANAGSLTITFSPAFSAAVTVSFFVAMRSGSRGYIVNTGGQNNTVGSIVVATMPGGAVPTVVLNGDWIAIGAR